MRHAIGGQYHTSWGHTASGPASLNWTSETLYMPFSWPSIILAHHPPPPPSVPLSLSGVQFNQVKIAFLPLLSEANTSSCASKNMQDPLNGPHVLWTPVLCFLIFLAASLRGWEQPVFVPSTKLCVNLSYVSILWHNCRTLAHVVVVKIVRWTADGWRPNNCLWNEIQDGHLTCKSNAIRFIETPRPVLGISRYSLS